jgi:hypothetical protein
MQALQLPISLMLFALVIVVGVSFAVFLCFFTLIRRVLLLAAILRDTMRLSAEPELHLFDPSVPGLPQEVSQYFEKVAQALTPFGFEIRTGCAVSEHGHRTKTLSLLLVNQRNKDVASAYAMYRKNGDRVVLKQTFTELRTAFKEGMVMTTTNSRHLNSFPLPSALRRMSFPMIDDVRRLHRLHQARVARDADQRVAILALDDEFRGDVRMQAYRSRAELLEFLGKIGRFRKFPDEPVYFPTWKGAILMAVSSVQPIAAIRRRRRDRKAWKLIRDLEGQ